MKQVLTCGPGLLIGIPTLGRPIPLEWALMYKGLNPPINYSVNVMVPWGKAIADARNEVCEKALAEGHKYVFFLGDDVLPPFATLKQLIFRMEQNPKIGVVGGVYCSKCDPPAPLVFRGNGVGSYWDWKAGEFFEVTGLGMDCTMIRTEILKELPRPWFKTVDEDNFKDAINEAEQWTEDLYFCKQVIEQTDYKIFCDSEILCRHADVYGNKMYSLPADSLPMRKFVGEKTKRAIDIGCGPVDRKDQFPEYDLVRVDIRDECNPDYRCDIRQLPFESESFDMVFSSHVLEHLGRNEYLNVLKEWLRLLKKDGELFLILPNIEWAIRESQSKKPKLNDMLNVFYGAQSNDYDYHYNAFWPDRITQILNELNMDVKSIEHIGYNMLIKANFRQKADSMETALAALPAASQLKVIAKRVIDEKKAKKKKVS